MVGERVVKAAVTRWVPIGVSVTAVFAAAFWAVVVLEAADFDGIHSVLVAGYVAIGGVLATGALGSVALAALAYYARFRYPGEYADEEVSRDAE